MNILGCFGSKQGDDSHQAIEQKGISVILFMNPLFDYDPDKSKKNAERQGIDFEQAQVLWKTKHVIIPVKQVGGEHRYAILGKIDDRLHMAVFTYRPPWIRLISCHKTDIRFERIYERGSHE